MSLDCERSSSSSQRLSNFDSGGPTYKISHRNRLNMFFSLAMLKRSVI